MTEAQCVSGGIDVCLHLPLQTLYGAAASDGVGPRGRGSH